MIIDCKLTVLDANNIQYEDNLRGNEEIVQGNVQGGELAILAIERFNHWVANYPNNFKREDLQVLGRHLYHSLFGDSKIQSAFQHTYRFFKEQKENDPNARLRLRLIFDRGASKLSTFPWEFIFLSPKMTGGKGVFLAGEDTDLILTRFIPKASLMETLEPEQHPLRILVVSCQPNCLPKLNATEIIKELKDSLHKPQEIEVYDMYDPDWNMLRKEIDELKPHIFHFIGHGKPKQIALKEDAKKIREESLLPKNKGKVPVDAHWIDHETVSALFANHQPRLVFLHACSGAEIDPLSFESIASELVYSKVPVVVAMQYPIPNDDARDFARIVYRQIGEGKDVDEAVKEGRRELGRKPPAWAHRRFGTPVIYLQSEKAIMIRRELSAPSDDLKDTSGEKVKCPNPLRRCEAWVRPTDKYCLVCDVELMKCPNCGNVKTVKWRCGICHYNPKPLQSTRDPITLQQKSQSDTIPHSNDLTESRLSRDNQ